MLQLTLKEGKPPWGHFPTGCSMALSLPLVVHSGSRSGPNLSLATHKIQSPTDLVGKLVLHATLSALGACLQQTLREQLALSLDTLQHG